MCGGGRDNAGVDALQLRWGETLVHLPWSRLRQEGGDPVRTREVVSVPPLLRPLLREPARGQDAPGPQACSEDQAAPWRQRLGGSANMMEPFPEKPKRMHHEIYMRLFWKHHEAEMEELVGMREWLDKLQQQLS
jgi:hypothetical protein